MKSKSDFFVAIDATRICSEQRASSVRTRGIFGLGIRKPRNQQNDLREFAK
jgi:hypothetical protein